MHYWISFALHFYWGRINRKDLILDGIKLDKKKGGMSLVFHFVFLLLRDEPHFLPDPSQTMDEVMDGLWIKAISTKNEIAPWESMHFLWSDDKELYKEPFLYLYRFNHELLDQPNPTLRSHGRFSFLSNPSSFARYLLPTSPYLSQFWCIILHLIPKIQTVLTPAQFSCTEPTYVTLSTSLNPFSFNLC